MLLIQSIHRLCWSLIFTAKKHEKNKIKEELQLEFILNVGIEKLGVPKKKGERFVDLGIV